jgi:glycine cleavage system H protein
VLFFVHHSFDSPGGQIMNIPSNLKYAKTDEWVKLDGNVATVGVSDYAQDQLSDIVFVEFTLAPGEQAKKDTTCVTLESVKAAADVNSPVSGKVVAVNDALPQNPEKVNSDPFGEAWMLKIEISNPAELDSLMDAAAYEKYCQERS